MLSHTTHLRLMLKALYWQIRYHFYDKRPNFILYKTETISHLPDTYLKEHPEVTWKKPIAMRNKLIHEYFGVDLDLVWNTVTQILPPFKQQIEALLATPENS